MYVAPAADGRRVAELLRHCLDRGDNIALRLWLASDHGPPVHAGGPTPGEPIGAMLRSQIVSGVGRSTLTKSQRNALEAAARGEVVHDAASSLSYRTGAALGLCGSYGARD